MTPAPGPFRSARLGAAAAAVVGWVAVLAAAAAGTPGWLEAWLGAWVFWVGLPLGALSLLMLAHLSGGAWGACLRRPLEAAALAIPLAGLLYLPVVLGLDQLYPWARPGEVSGEPLLQHRQPWLNPTSFVLRQVLYVVLWTGAAAALRRWSLQRTRRASLRLQAFSGPALLLHMVLVSLASLDWIMSLETHFYSTGFGWVVMVSQGLSALALGILATALLPPGEGPHRKVLHDLGNLLLAFVLLWAYVGFAQLLVVWYGNLAEDNSWYFDRGFGPAWAGVSAFLILGQFVAPFLALLPERTKVRPRRLRAVALWTLGMEAVFAWWQVRPTLSPDRIPWTWLDPAAHLALGGTLALAWLWALGRAPLLPEPLREDEP